MELHNTKTIKYRGSSTEVDVYENNELGLQGWRLMDVVVYLRKDKVEYIYKKRKWWAFPFTTL